MLCTVLWQATELELLMASNQLDHFPVVKEDIDSNVRDIQQESND